MTSNEDMTKGAETRKEPALDVNEDDVEAVDPRLLSILVCPVTKGSLTYDRDAGELFSKSARVAYPIRKGIPLLTRDAARPLRDDDGA